MNMVRKSRLGLAGYLNYLQIMRFYNVGQNVQEYFPFKLIFYCALNLQSLYVKVNSHANKKKLPPKMKVIYIKTRIFAFSCKAHIRFPCSEGYFYNISLNLSQF